MEAAAWGFVGTLVGAVVGALASIGTTFFNNRNAAALQSKASEAARAEQRRTFQRETLLQLQEEFHRFLRIAGQVHMKDKAAYRSTGKWGVSPLSDKVDTDYMEAGRDVNKLIERITDDALRTEIKGILAMTAALTLAKSHDESERLHYQLVIRGQHAMEHIGVALRAQY